VVKEIHDGNYNLVVMGRRGRSVLKDLIIGGVSSAVINRCFEPTIAIYKPITIKNLYLHLRNDAFKHRNILVDKRIYI